MNRCRQIVGLFQVRNEDLFIEQAIANVFNFCDRIVVADHKSTDQTSSIVRGLASRTGRIEYRHVNHASDTHELARQYADTPTWVFPVDGDELYDADRLPVLREAILAGQHDKYRQIYGNALHCVELDRQRQRAKGYLAPPSRTVTKLYNFNALYDWTGPCMERCHGGRIVFKPGYAEASNLSLYDVCSWDDSPFRLLHVCFLTRSSGEQGGRCLRPNIMEMAQTPLVRRAFQGVLRFFGKKDESRYKREKYARGPLVECNAEPFFRSRTGW